MDFNFTWDIIKPDLLIYRIVSMQVSAVRSSRTLELLDESLNEVLACFSSMIQAGARNPSVRTTSHANKVTNAMEESANPSQDTAPVTLAARRTSAAWRTAALPRSSLETGAYSGWVTWPYRSRYPVCSEWQSSYSLKILRTIETQHLQSLPCH